MLKRTIAAIVVVLTFAVFTPQASAATVEYYNGSAGNYQVKYSSTVSGLDGGDMGTNQGWAAASICTQKRINGNQYQTISCGSGVGIAAVWHTNLAQQGRSFCYTYDGDAQNPFMMDCRYKT